MRSIICTKNRMHHGCSIQHPLLCAAAMVRAQASAVWPEFKVFNGNGH